MPAFRRDLPRWGRSRRASSRRRGRSRARAGRRPRRRLEHDSRIDRRYGAALEICDIGTLPNEPDSVVAANDFHRAVAFGDLRPALPPNVAGELIVNGALRASGAPPRDVPERLRAAARILAAVGEALRTGDRIITGLIVQVPIAIGDDVVARVDPHAPAHLRIAA